MNRRAKLHVQGARLAHRYYLRAKRFQCSPVTVEFYRVERDTHLKKARAYMPVEPAKQFALRAMGMEIQS